MKIFEKHSIIFFLDDFHRGAVNYLIHFIGFTLLGYGLGRSSLFLIIISLFVMELGHFYNYGRGIHREQAVEIIPLQWLAWIIFVAAGFALTRIMK